MKLLGSGSLLRVLRSLSIPVFSMGGVYVVIVGLVFELPGGGYFRCGANRQGHQGIGPVMPMRMLLLFVRRIDMNLLLPRVPHSGLSTRFKSLSPHFNYQSVIIICTFIFSSWSLWNAQSFTFSSIMLLLFFWGRESRNKLKGNGETERWGERHLLHSLLKKVFPVGEVNLDPCTTPCAIIRLHNCILLAWLSSVMCSLILYN